ncbi:hypothetical protein JMN32_18225, partial [Fulvivirga sp. 29W222]
MKKILLTILFFLTLLISKAQQCDTLSFEWENPAPTTTIYMYGGGYVTGIPDPANSTNSTDDKTVFEGFASPTPGTTPVGAVRLGLGFLTDANDNTRFDVNVYDDNGSSRPGTLVGGVTNISPTQLGVASNAFKNFWITLPSNPVPTTSTFYIGIVIHPGDATDRLVIQSNTKGQGNGDNSNSITTTKFGNERLLQTYSADIDLNIIPKLGAVEDPSFSYSNTSYCSNSVDPTPAISGDPGGVFSSSPTGLVINSTTGKIDLSASTATTFTVTYTTAGTCPQSKKQTVTIVNDTPVIFCPGDQNVSFNSSCQYPLPDYTGLATATDNCSTPTVTQSPAAGTIITSAQTITLTANDGNGNTAQCTFNVIPADITNPVITCPSDQNVSFDSSCQFTLPDYTSLATASDNCSVPTVTQSP